MSAVLVLAGGSADGQRLPAQSTAPTVSQDFLESIVRLECAFTVAAAGTWSGADPIVRTVPLPTPLAVSLSDINVADGGATSRSGGRTASVSARSDRSNLYFLDVGLDGVARLTTVFSQESPTGRLKAVHTRTGRAAEQFYGDCAVMKPAGS